MLITYQETNYEWSWPRTLKPLQSNTSTLNQHLHKSHVTWKSSASTQMRNYSYPVTPVAHTLQIMPHFQSLLLPHLRSPPILAPTVANPILASTPVDTLIHRLPFNQKLQELPIPPIDVCYQYIPCRHNQPYRRHQFQCNTYPSTVTAKSNEF